MAPGGLLELKGASPETQAMCVQVRPDAEQNSQRTFEYFYPILFHEQPVAGINFFIKVHVGGAEYVHVRVFQALPSESKKLSLVGLLLGKTLDDPLEYFEPNLN
ncbi:hypothetical protein ACEWY4_011122 [Coilia grayii]|uniref:Cystatin-B n=1 Tax=Coilia grayii TaxID=363190 RepID=A0ABD1K3V7_9TELE